MMRGYTWTYQKCFPRVSLGERHQKSKLLGINTQARFPDRISVMVGQKSNHSDSSEDEESGSDKSDESVLENSDSEEDDGKLESLSAFVDSFRYQKEGPKPEINTEAMETVSQGSNSP